MRNFKAGEYWQLNKGFNNKQSMLVLKTYIFIFIKLPPKKEKIKKNKQRITICWIIPLEVEKKKRFIKFCWEIWQVPTASFPDMASFRCVGPEFPKLFQPCWPLNIQQSWSVGFAVLKIFTWSFLLWVWGTPHIIKREAWVIRFPCYLFANIILIIY